MTANSIAQYLEQRRTVRPSERAEPRSRPWAALVNASSQRESGAGEGADFRPYAFKSAEPAAVRPGAAYTESASAIEALARRQSGSASRTREVESGPTPAEIEQQVTEAYHRGVQEGLDAARNEAATARALERAEIQKRAVVERLDFQMNEYAKVGEAITQSLVEVERRLASSVAKILRPFLLARATSRAVDELAAHISKLASAGHPPLIKLSGPEPLLKLLKQRLGSLAVDVDFTPDSAIEVKAEISHTTIATELGSWIELIESLGESADE